MKRSLTTFAVVLLVAAAVGGCGGDSDSETALGDAAADASTGQVLVLPRTGSIDPDYMIKNELSVMVEMLEEEGYVVVVATSDGNPYRGISYRFDADISIAEVDIDDYDAVLLPCMAVETAAPAEMVEIVRQASAEGKPVAAQHGAVRMLAMAGILADRSYAAETALASFLFDGETEGVYSGTEVVRDGSVITSGTCSKAAQYYGRPDGTPELTQTLIEVLAEGV